MSSEHNKAADEEAEAHRLVGKFLQSFALLEQAIDQGIGKLVGLEGPQNDIVCSSIPFAKKVDVLFSAEFVVAKMPDRDRVSALKKTRSLIMEMNEARKMFAHNTFSQNEDGGVTFRRVVASTKLSVKIDAKTPNDVNALCATSVKLVEQIGTLISEMQPYVPSLDFSDPRNSGYLALL